MEYLVTIIALMVLGIIFFKVGMGMRRITILEYEKGLKYVKGNFKAVIGPGQYWYIPFFVVIQKIDVRPRFVSITGQEVLSSDGVTLKVSLAANYEISDPNVAINKSQSFQEALYLELQLALRTIIGSAEIDTVLNSRDELSKKLTEMTETKARDLGLRLISANLKDIMFPGKLKEIFAQVVNARKEGLAALEKARGETAALRSLANAAKMIESNPSLMQLRLVQALGESKGNTLILGMPSQVSPIPIKTKDTEQLKELTESRGEPKQTDPSD
jgi:regulator of protease activity HflC (stomatin/prohibitin superfamily)